VPRERSGSPPYLDGLPTQKTKPVTQYVKGRNGALALHHLPGYSHDLNLDELVWSHAERTGNARRPLQKGEKLGCARVQAVG